MAESVIKSFPKTVKWGWVGLGICTLCCTSVEATDFTINGATSTATISNVTVNGVSTGALLERGDGVDSAGNGVYRNILLLNGPGGTNTPSVAKGYNYKGSQTQPFDETNPNGFDAYVRMGDLPIVKKSGVDYVGFALDSQEQGNDNYISIDEFRIYGYAEPSYPTLSGSYVNTEANLGNLGTLIYSMDSLTSGSGGNDILLNLYASSSGKSDLRIFIPVSYFTASGVDSNATMYIWTKEGSRGTIGGLEYGDNGGAEQWSVLGLFDTSSTAPTLNTVLPAPEPATIVLGAGCLLFVCFHGFRRFSASKKSVK